MDFDTAQLKEILLTKNYVSEEDFKAAEAYSEEKKGTMLNYFLANEILTDEIFGQAVAEYYGVPYVDLGAKRPEKELVLKIPIEVAKEFDAIVFEEGPNKVSIATDLPLKEGLPEKIGTIFPNSQIFVFYATYYLQHCPVK